MPRSWEMRTEIKRLHSNLNTSIAYVTRDQIEAMTLATRIVVMKDGVLELLDGAKIKGLNSGESRDLLIGLRPENITNPAPDSRLVAPCRIKLVEPAGSDTFITTSLGKKPITARLRADTVVSHGAIIDLASASYFDASNGERLN